MEQNTSQKQINNLPFLKILLKWKFHLIIICIIALLAGFITAKFILKPRFKSSSLVYPSNIRPYSDESETEQLIQWMKAKIVQDSVIKNLDLGNHYGISPKQKYSTSIIEYLYNKNVSINKTMFESIDITVTDDNPEMAKKIIEKIIDYTNKVILNAQAVKFQEVAIAYEKAIAQKEFEIQATKDEFNSIAKTYGLYNIEGQSREITRGVLRGSGNSSELKKMQQGIEEKGGDVAYLYYRFENLDAELSELKLKYDQAQVDYSRPFSFTNIISYPQVSDKKYTPKTTMVMLYFMLCALVLSTVFIVVWENRKNIQEKIQ